MVAKETGRLVGSTPHAGEPELQEFAPAPVDHWAGPTTAAVGAARSRCSAIKNEVTNYLVRMNDLARTRHTSRMIVKGL